MRDFTGDIGKELSEKADELLDLYNAGRIVILPCIPGSTVYKLQEQHDGKYRIAPCCMGLTQIVENLNLFDDVYFAEIEDARKAIADRKCEEADE